MCQTECAAPRTSAALLDRAADWSDMGAWLRILEIYRPLVLKWALPLVGGDREAAEEIAQRVWIDLARRLPSFRYDPDRGFRKWLRALVRSRAVDYLRQRRRDPAALLDLEALAPTALDADDPDDPPIDPAHAALLGLLTQAERDVRARVDEATWRAFVLRAVDGLSLAETARIVGKSVSAAANAVYRVDRRLKAAAQAALEQAPPDLRALLTQRGIVPPPPGIESQPVPSPR